MKRMTERNQRKLSKEWNADNEEIKDDIDLVEDELEEDDDIDLVEDELEEDDGIDLAEDELEEDDDIDLAEDELEEDDGIDLAEDELEEDDDIDLAEDELEEDDDIDLAEDELEEDDDIDLAEDELEEDDDIDLAEDELEEDDDIDLAEDELEDEDDLDLVEGELEEDNELESESTMHRMKNTNKGHKTIGLTVSPIAKKELDEQLEEFLSTKIKKFSNVDSKGSSFLSVVKSETGTSIKLTKDTTVKLNNPTQLSVGFVGSYLVLCNADGLNTSSYQGKYKNGRVTVYNTGLVDAIIKQFSLDYSNKTSISFSEGHYKQQGRAILYVKLV